MDDNVIIINEQKNFKHETRQSFLTRLIVNTLALGASSYLIDDFNVESMSYLILAGLIFTCLNAVIKPLVVLLMIPFIVITLGLLYPLVNVIVLNMLDGLMGSHLEITGIFNAILVSIIVSIVNYAVTNIFK